MTLPITLKWEAERDIEEAFDWYEEQSEGLGSAFVEAVEAALANIAHNPRGYQVIYRSAPRRDAAVSLWPLFRDPEGGHCYHRVPPRQARSGDLASACLEHFRASLNRKNALALCFVAVPDGKPLHTFPGTALAAPPVLLQPRHDLHEVAGAVADVELLLENPVPAVLHRAGRAGQGEEIGAVRDAGAGA